MDKPTIYTKELGWHRQGDLTLPEFIPVIQKRMAQGWRIFVKFTCQNCKARQTSDKPNVIHAAGYTCEECGELTKPKAYGFMAEGPLIHF